MMRKILVSTLVVAVLILGLAWFAYRRNSLKIEFRGPEGMSLEKISVSVLDVGREPMQATTNSRGVCYIEHYFEQGREISVLAKRGEQVLFDAMMVVPWRRSLVISVRTGEAEIHKKGD